MELNSRITTLEQEVNLLKAEIKQVLVDLRDALLNHENPFSSPFWAEAATETDSPRVKKVEAEPQPAAAEEAAAQPPSSMPSDSRTTLPQPDTADWAPVASAQPWQPERAEHGRPFSAQRRAGGWSVLTVASLARWVESAIKQVGRDRFEAIVAIYDLATGGVALPPEAKETLLKLAALSDMGDERPPATMKDCIALLAQLDTILGSDGRHDAALLSLLTDLDVR